MMKNKISPTQFQRPVATMQCKVCGRTFFAERSKVLTGARQCCSLSCRGRAARAALPKQHGRKPSHGACVNGKVSRLYRIWSGIKRRCHSPTTCLYGRYGALGIRMCKTWQDSFALFKEWAESHGYRDGLQCDRINNALGYAPSNCRWVTPRQNCANRKNSIIFPGGLTTADVAKQKNMSASAIRQRLQSGLTMDEVLRIPKVPNGGARKHFWRTVDRKSP